MKKEQQERLKNLVDLQDSEIDTSDIPEWTEQDFAKAVLFHDMYKPKKQHITTRNNVTERDE